jgi:cytochrome c-type biogenesis protein CcmH/NrfG
MAGGNKARNRDLAAVALASGKRIAEAGAAAGVTERTVQNWLTDEAFAGRVRELRSRMVSAAAAKLAGAMGKAADTLEKLLDSADEAVQRHAAVKILELGQKAVEIEELQGRMAEIEARLSREKT